MSKQSSSSNKQTSRSRGSKSADSAVKRPVQSKRRPATKQRSAKRPLLQRLQDGWRRLQQRRRDFLQRRPHRSFRRTHRRDYRRSLAVPGYWSLTARAVKLLWQHKALFGRVVLLYVIIMVLAANLMAEETYVQMREAVTAVQEEGFLSGATATLLVFWGVLLGQTAGGGAGADPAAQLITMLLGLSVWLTTIWLVRAIAAGHRPNMRDGLYSAGSPVAALMVLAVIALLQLLPAAIAVIVYSAADASGVLAWTPVLMLAGGAVALIVVLSLYWMTATGFAMVIATLPGVYPLQAMKLAGDIVIGRRVRMLLRMVWLATTLVVAWAMVLVPIILLDGAMKSWWPIIEAVPIVPVTALLLAASSIVFAAVYIYLFYRKVVDDDSAPA